MSKENITSIEENHQTGQRKVTIPKAIAAAKGLKGKDKVAWYITERGLEILKQNPLVEEEK